MLPHNADIEINKKGDKELIIKSKGKKKRTLNELDVKTYKDLVEEIMAPTPVPSISADATLAYRDGSRAPFQNTYSNVSNLDDGPPITAATDEATSIARDSENIQTRAIDDDITNMAVNPDIPSLDNSGLGNIGNDLSDLYQGEFSNKYNDRNSVEESLSTASIAMGPDNSFWPQTRRKKMNSRKRKLMREYSPDFEAGEYKPGKPGMHKAKGEGVAKKHPTKADGQKDVELTSHGDPFGMKRKHNVAMGKVSDDGVEHEAPSYESKHGEADDGYSTKVGHDWPDKPKNNGCGIEKFKGERWSDGGVLSSGGKSGSESAVEEGWNPTTISALMEGADESAIRHLFDRWVRGIKTVRLSDFEKVLHSSGIDFPLTESAFTGLLAQNKAFMFLEAQRSNGSRSWVRVPLNENFGLGCANEPSQEMGKPTDLNHGFGDDWGEPDEDGADIQSSGGCGYGDDDLGTGQDIDSDMELDSEPGMATETDLYNASSDVDQDFMPDDEVDLNGVTDDDIRSIGNDDMSLANEPSSSWAGPAHDDFSDEGFEEEDDTIGLHESKVKKNYLSDQGDGPVVSFEDSDVKFDDLGSIDSLLKKEPNNKSGVTPIIKGTGVGMEVPVSTSIPAAASIKENVDTLSRHVAPYLLKAERRIAGPYNVSYCVLESKRKKTSKKRKNLAEALVDAEENLQFGSARDNYLVAEFSRPNGGVIFRQSIPLVTINSRRPYVSEGKALFRSKSNAAAYMKILSENKKSSKVDHHPYGFAITTING